MKLKKFKEHNSIVILTTEKVFQYTNNDNRKAIATDKQIEMVYRQEDELKVPHQVFYNEMDVVDYFARHPIIKYFKKLLSPLKEEMSKNLQQYEFHESVVSANTDVNNPYTIINKYQLKACKKNGTDMLKEDQEIIQNKISEIFIEANRLISRINTMGEDDTILSIILTKEEGDRINPVVYKNERASHMVYVLFNVKKPTSKLALSFNIGLGKKVSLISQKLKFLEVLLDREQYIKPINVTQNGSVKSGCLDIIGPRFDNNIITNNIFDEKVYCKGKDGSKEENERIYKFLLNSANQNNFLIVIRPSQPYLCHEGINAHKYIVVGIKEI